MPKIQPCRCTDGASLGSAHREVKLMYENQDGADHPEQQEAVLVRHLQAVFVHQRHDIEFALGQPQKAQVPVNFALDVLDGACLFGIGLLDRSSSRNQVDRGRSSVASGGRRASLESSSGCRFLGDTDYQ
jgi:hypothetical protein